MTCTRCAKRLSRKTARIIDGKPLCSSCLFAPNLKGASVSVTDAREIALSWIDEYERETIAERRAQYGAQFTADQQAAIEQTHRHLRAGVNIMADAIAMEARQSGPIRRTTARAVRHRPTTPSLQTPQGGDS